MTPPSWQVWIKISPDGRVFQCRVDPEGTVDRKNGRLEGSSIFWSADGPEETLELAGPSMVVTTDGGAFSFERKRFMSGKCRAPF